MAAYNGMHMVDRTIDYFEPPAVQSGATLEQRAATPFSTPAEDAPKRLAYCAGALLAAEAYRKIKCEKRINSEWWKVHKYITR